MASFSTLPSELVTNAFAFVRKSRDSLIGSADTLQVRSRRDLNNLSLVNRTFQELVGTDPMEQDLEISRATSMHIRCAHQSPEQYPSECEAFGTRGHS